MWLPVVMAGTVVVADPLEETVPRTVDRDRVIELLRHGAQLVEVLPRHEYDEEHLPDAVHLPLKELSPATTAVLDRSRAVIVYCWDGL